jgi:hypothetical protein
MYSSFVSIYPKNVAIHLVSIIFNFKMEFLKIVFQKTLNINTY